MWHLMKSLEVFQREILVIGSDFSSDDRFFLLQYLTVPDSNFVQYGYLLCVSK
jgi:hypothetical protein